MWPGKNIKMKHTHIYVGTGVSQDVISDKGQALKTVPCHLIVSLNAY